ncbi:response regulator transcription factor [Kribbella shirazensis]|uniref:DNA-binding NarL/FixJ family response regulator n=1 Tax=Kribbella shirazensis TaxID=1105143 RepID=A0A7X5VD86_9ACTN|nr:response regulator transcription factor [Kribbella shirazensis]NIK59100.1 DNA-binding NarL/FixJ family response regulator [Kribbella shirazensis]
MSNRIRVVVADGHTLTRFGLLELVSGQADMVVVRETGLAAELVAAVAELHADVVVLDTALPDADGMSIARVLRDRHPELGIVLLTSDGADDVLFRALESGLSAFVPKVAPAADVLVAIRHAAVAAGSFIASGLGPAVARRQARLGAHDAATAADAPLSPREAAVLELLGRGMSVVAIAAALYVSPSTAKTYVSRVYEKLGAANRTQALMVGLRRGLIGQAATGT